MATFQTDDTQNVLLFWNDNFENDKFAMYRKNVKTIFKKRFLIKSDKFILVIIYTKKTGPEVLYTYTTSYRHLQKPSPGYENANEL